MEGSHNEVKNRSCGGVQKRRPLAILLRNAFIVSLSLVSLSFAQTFDVMIIERPGNLIAYDAFQQSVNPKQESALQPFAPIRILKNRDVLSDGITRCSKVEVGGELFYLLLNERGTVAESGDLGTVRIFRHVKAFRDTIEVLGSGHVVFQKPVTSSRRYCAAGERLECYFEVTGVVYARRMDSGSDFGWIRLPREEEGRWWSVVHAQPQHVDLSPMIRDRLLERIDDVNLAYTEIYALLTHQARKKLPVPQWQVETTGNAIVCVLKPSAAAPFYRRSIKSLAATLQAYLVGTGFDVIQEEDAIRIVKR